MTKNISPNQREDLSTLSIATNSSEYLTSKGGALNVISITGLVPLQYDYIAYTNTNSTTDTYQFYTGGAGGTLVSTLTIVYTDSTKTIISTMART